MIFTPKALIIGFVFANCIAAATPKPADLLANLPLTFEENRGQWDSRVLFAADCRGAKLFITKDGAVFALASDTKQSSIRLSVEAANKNAIIRGEGEIGGLSNYLLGSNRANWVTGARRFTAVRIKEVKAGVDIVFYGHSGALEYDLIVRPTTSGATPVLTFEGAESLTVNPAGDLVARSQAGQLIQRRPMVWQEAYGKKNTGESRLFH